MEEAIPVLAGVAVAFLALRLPPFRAKAFWLTLLAALLGMAWTVASGEAARHWVYLLLDAAQAMVALHVLLWLTRRWRIGSAARTPRA